VRVPDEAIPGTAKVTFSFESWKEGRVASSTIDLPVKRPEPEKKNDKLEGRKE
jgi:hypothetical protein